MLRTIFCNHYQAMSDHDECKVGVAYETFKGIPHDKRPCFCRNGCEPNGGCDLQQIPTAEETAALEKEINERFNRTCIASQAIVDFLGGPWKRGMEGSSGKINCPVCGIGYLSYSRLGYNGHIHAQCDHEGCVSWME
jgi:hypothetical protein